MERDNEASGDRKGKAEIKYTVIIERGPTSYGAYIPDLPGCVAAGDTREEVESLIVEAVADHVELMAEHGETIPKPASTAIEVEVQHSSAIEKLAVEAGR